MPRKPKTPWLVMCDGGFKCLRCGGAAQATIPAPLKVFIAEMKLFMLKHEDCWEPVGTESPAQL